MIVIDPVSVTSAVLINSSVAEADYAAWAGGTTYAVGARVIVAAAHRVYESLVGGNVGNPPAASPEQWLDVGPTNRWAMFDAAAGARTSAGAAIEVTLQPTVPLDAIGLVDVTGTSFRLRVVDSAAATVYDQTVGGVDAHVFLGLPQPSGQKLLLTINPLAGVAAVGKVVVGNSFDLGETEANPTVSITDYSRRETDDFGVTTVVERAWTKRLNLRTRIASDAADAWQAKMVALRARPALWAGYADTAALITYGFYKDFGIDLQLGEITFCSVSIEGLPAADVSDSGGDPAVDGVSDLVVIRPLPVTDAILTSSNVPENDYGEWSGAFSYGLGDRVIRGAVHRIFESAQAGNLGHDPAAADDSVWIDVGPTTRWAMFDQALGSVTTRASSIVVTLTPTAAVNGLAVLDTDGAVRVQSGSYDRTIAAPDRRVFLDLAVASGTAITVTISAAAGSTNAMAGTLLIGAQLGLGTLETSPALGISDFSRKDVDDFGNTTVVERAWAKRMTLRSLIASTAAETMIRRIASLRATPALWVGPENLETLAVYGFVKDFTLTLGTTVSPCSMTIEGLTKAPPLRSPPLASYVHRAYANSLDGTVDFTTGAPGARVYIGWLVDSTEAASVDPAAYDWSRLTGEDGGAGSSPPLITLSATRNYAKYDNADTYVGGAITFTAIRQNVPGSGTSFRIYRASDNAMLDQNTADAYGAYAGGPYAGSGGDALVFTAGHVPGMISSYGTFRVEAYRDGYPVTASVTIAKVKDGADGQDGADGINGTNGAPGAPGADGQPSYVHIAYADSADGSANFTTGAPGSRKFIGLLTDHVAADSSSYAAYTWSQLTGDDGLNGSNGVPGTPGADGLPSYAHFAYANSADGSVDFHVSSPTGRTYLGVYSDSTAADSTNPASYTWSLIKGADGAAGVNGSNGAPGAPGSNGQTSYVHVAYADSSDGATNFTTGVPGSRKFIGILTDFTSADSGTYSDYTWSKLTGDNGTNGSNGTPGAPGADGTPSYAHFAYANAADGSVDFHVSDPAGRRYIGVYSDSTLADSTSPASYTWSLVKGADGIAGAMTVQIWTVQAGSDGVTKSGQLSQYSNLSVRQGTTDITGACSVTVTPSDSGAITASYSSPTVVLSKADAAGYVDVAVTYGGVAIAGSPFRIQIYRPVDQPPPQGSSSQSGQMAMIAPTSTSYSGATSDVVTLRANSSGVINFEAAIDYVPDQPSTGIIRAYRAAASPVYRAPGGSTWSYASETVGTNSTAQGGAEPSSVAGFVSISGAAISGLTANAYYECAIAVRKYSGGSPATAMSGYFTVSQ